MPVTLSVSEADFLTLAYRPDARVLTARWLRAVSLAELQQGFTRIRELSQEQQAGHWLVDVRRRTELDAASSGWVASVLLPAAAVDLGPTPLSVAYLLSPARNEQLHTDDALKATVQQAQSYIQPYTLRTFLDEGQAMQWLSEQR
jgi:hypothetical protein